MKTKFQELIKRKDFDELKSYLAALPEGKPLDYPDEKTLIEQMSELATKAYLTRFRFSDKACCIFIRKATRPLRRAYINRYGLPQIVQKLIIDENLIDAASDFTEMHFFDDVEYLLKHGSAEIIRQHITRTNLRDDEQVLALLHNKNSSLFGSYVSKGYYISDKVMLTIIQENNLKAFRTVIARQYRIFKKLARKLTIEEIRVKHADEAILSEELQVAVLEEFEPSMTEVLLKNTLLYPEAQKFMLSHNFDAHWLKLHVSHLYGIAGYRFIPELEPALFKALSLKGMDDCLTQFRQQDDQTFVRYASPAAVIKYIKSFWLTDEAQIAVFRTGNTKVMEALISRFSPEHGMCWQAEVEMVKMCSPETIQKYISFHTMCREALELLQKKCLDMFNYYFTKHQY